MFNQTLLPYQLLLLGNYRSLQTDLLWLIVKSSALGISPLLSPGAPPVAGAGVGGLAIESAAKGNQQFLE